MLLVCQMFSDLLMDLCVSGDLLMLLSECDVIWRTEMLMDIGSDSLLCSVSVLTLISSLESSWNQRLISSDEG